MKELSFEKNRLIVYFFRKYFVRSLRRNFSNIKVRGLTEAQALVRKCTESKRPVVYCANHSSWWDAVMIYYLSYDVLMTDSYCLMEKKQLDIYPYFGKTGAVPVVREDARYSLYVIQRLTDHMNSSASHLWIFPQGEITPNTRRPFHFYSGIGDVISMLHRPALINCYFDFRFEDGQYPVANVEFFGLREEVSLQRSERKAFSNELASEFGRKSDEIEKEFADGRIRDLKILLEGRKSVSDRAFTKFS
ncbi:MAG: lysophospholipid acyltransferase family protein [Ignavibacteria bacterium]|nr:lysophospholipid acyltransferase family protein [Ignavibacteria bacterium]